MSKKDDLLDEVSRKTNVSKQAIIDLANLFQSKDLTNESNLRELIITVSKVANKPLTNKKIDEIMELVKNEQYKL